MPEDPSKSATVEVATFRSDLGYSDGRHPDEVRFSRIRKKMWRAATSPSTACCSIRLSGEVLDFVGGREDLEAGIIRTIGDPERRFAEDKLRMLRAVRFAARFEYSIDPATFAAMQRTGAANSRSCRASACAMN